MSRVRWDYLLALGGVLLVAAFFAFEVPGWFWHPLGTQVCRAQYHTAAQVRDCLGYNYHSGIGSDLSEITLVVGLIIFLRRHNCHARGCWRIGKFRVDGTPYMVCARHHKLVPTGGPTRGDIEDAANGHWSG